jgi:hypothetical protein
MKYTFSLLLIQTFYEDESNEIYLVNFFQVVRYNSIFFFLFF